MAGQRETQVEEHTEYDKDVFESAILGVAGKRGGDEAMCFIYFFLTFWYKDSMRDKRVFRRYRR